jgi:hypothetical protein
MTRIKLSIGIGHEIFLRGVALNSTMSSASDELPVGPLAFAFGTAASSLRPGMF